MKWPAIACSAYWLLAILAALRHPRPKSAPITATPVSILKPIRGRDEAFYTAIESHVLQDHPAFEILFGVRDPADPALPDLHRLIAAYPQIPIRIVTEAPVTPNGKVGMLIALAQAARHPILLVNDSDILVEPDYLRRVTAPLADPSIGLVTCLYRARGASFPARFEAIGIAASFVPSILVARLLGVAEFALGSTMAFRAESLPAIGGFESIANYLADDYQLGARISATGRRVVLAEIPVETNLGAGTWRDVWKHQIRWARTVRVSRGAGYAGSVITHAALWSLLAPWPFGMTCYTLRLIAAALSARTVRARIPWHLLPFRDLFETAVWAASLFGNKVEWRGELLRLGPAGTLEKFPSVHSEYAEQGSAGSLAAGLSTRNSKARAVFIATGEQSAHENSLAAGLSSTIGSPMISGFKAFLLKTNALALAVGVIIGAAVGKVVSSLVADILMPLISLVVPNGDWRSLKFVLSTSTGPDGKPVVNSVNYGLFLGNILDFVIIALCVYLITRAFLKEPPPPSTKACPKCLETIPAAALKCKFCTADL